MKDLAKIEEIYHAARELPESERESFLQETCGADEDLRQEVRSLLTFDDRAEDFIEIPPGDVASALFNSNKPKDLVGQNLGHYRLLSTLGIGGMGEVYLAEDTKLERKIALKLLPAQFSEDKERKKRFEQEAKAISTLNHPNIITLYGIERIEDLNFIATEFIDGKTLRELIAENSLSWQETIDIALQITNALESAHSLGIIHRDIKPANIMIRRDGIVKILDFGLAKLSKLGGDSVDLETREHTAQNSVMGTINYMSPEQALGETVDFRTDIFSFGVVLYEMLTGTKPFNGISDAAIYNATINQQPAAISEINAEIPNALERIVFQAIEKKRDERYQTISELKDDLRQLKENPNSELIAKKFGVKQRSNFVKFAIPAVALISLFAISLFLYFNRSSNQTAESINLSYTQLTSQIGEELFPSLSPDGKSFLYSSRESGNWDIYLKQIDGSNQVNLTKDSTADDRQAVFSPDGKQIAFRSEREGRGIFVMNANGGDLRQIADTGFFPVWSPDGKQIVYCVDSFPNPFERSTIPSEIWRVEVATGKKNLVTESDGVQPSWSPNGKRIAFWGLKGAQRDIFTVAAAGGEPTPITNDTATDWNPFWSSDGKYLYFLSNRSGSMNLWRIAIDEDSGKILGNPASVTIPTNYGQFFSLGRDGSLIYSQATIDFNLWRIGFNPATENIDQKAEQVTTDSLIKTDPDISPDNKSMVFASVGSPNEDLYLANSDGSGIRLLTETPYKERIPIWSPDGSRIAFTSNKSGGAYDGWMINPDGSNLRKITPTSPNISTLFPVWSPDGKSLLFTVSNSFPIITDPDKTAEEQTIVQLPPAPGKDFFMASSWSPDGKKIAGYTTSENYLKRNITIYDIATRQYEDLVDFGGTAFWLSDSRRLIFCHEDKIFLLDTQSRKLKELLSVKPNIIDSIALNKDNRSIFYSVKKKESDIWMANP